MAEQDSTLRKIDWKSIFPWMLLFRVFSVSITGQVLLLATIGTTLVPLGWRFSQLLFVSQEDDMEVEEDSRDAEFTQLVRSLRRWPGDPSRSGFRSPSNAVGDGPISNSRLSAGGLMSSSVQWVSEVTDAIVQPIVAALGPRKFFRRRIYFVFGCLWMLFVWGLLAGMICRLAVARLAQDERLTLRETFHFSRLRWHSHSTAPLIPLCGLVLMAASITLFSVMLRTGTWYGWILGLFWIPILVLGCLMAVVKIGLLFGWPLMWPAVATEETGDVFEATSRSFSYTFQRPLHYLGYAIVASLIGALAVLLVQFFSNSVIQLASWAAAAGGGSVWNELTSETGGGKLIGFGNGVAQAIATAFSHAFFWCSVTGIYLLLRRNVNQTDLTDVYMEDEATRYGLPPLEVKPPAAEPVESAAVIPLEMPAEEGPSEETQESPSDTAQSDTAIEAEPSASDADDSAAADGTSDADDDSSEEEKPS